MTTIYKICPGAIWRAAEREGVFHGFGIDEVDGFVHLSSHAQVRDTAARFFAGEKDLMLVAIDSRRLGEALKWEETRSGDTFPHLYDAIDLSAVVWVKPLPLGANGQHRFPALQE